MILIDGNMLAHRAFHKMDFLANSAGVHTGMEYGFLRSVESLQRKFDDKIIICFDSKYNRKKENKRYKANRTKMKDSFYQRLKELQYFLSNFWDITWMEGEEADDIMYSLAYEIEEKIYLYSNDNDLLQCVNERIFVLKSHDSNLYIWNAAKVREKFGVPPELLVLFRSFVGDKSDNLEGVSRIQKRILVDAILECEDVEDILKKVKHIMNHTQWSINMLNKIREFIVSGLWQENYDLMKLQKCSYICRCKQLLENHVIEKLREWEIGSLDLCKKYRSELVNPESEF